MSRLRDTIGFGLGRDLLLAVIVCGAAVLIALSIQLGMTQRDLRQRSLERAARYLEAHLQVRPDGVVRLPMPPGSSWSSFGYPAVVFDHAGRVLYKRPSRLNATVTDALFARRLPPDGQPARRPIQFFELNLGEQQIIGAVLRVGSGDGERFFAVYKDEHAPDVLIDDVVRKFPYRSIQVLLPVFLLLLVGCVWIVRRRMRPIAEVSAIAGTIGPHTLNLRLPEAHLPEELQPIVRAVNGALARLDDAATAQREFLRRAAHQLRTPLTVLMARASTLEDTDIAAELRGDIAEIARIIAQLLQLSELDALPDDATAVADLAAVGEAVRDNLVALAARREQRIRLVRPDGAVLARGDANVIEIAVCNLVENALQHSPDRAIITIRVQGDRQLAVIDAGPGVPEELYEKIFEPFWSNDSQGGRAGLGLTIVRRIAERYGARPAIATAPVGGAIFTLRFAPPAVPLGELDQEALRASLPASLAQRRRRAALGPAIG